MKDKKKTQQRTIRGNKRPPRKGVLSVDPDDVLKAETTIGDEVHARGMDDHASKWREDKVEILGGVAIIYTTPKSGGNWQFRTWLPAEKKYVYRSLKTKNLHEATKKAEELYIQIRTETTKGYKFFAITFEELIERYKDYQKTRAERGLITEGRRTTIHSVLNAFQRFVGKGKKVNEVEGVKYKQYYSFRQKEKPDIKDQTLKNERAVITNLYKFGRENSYLNMDTHPKFEELKFSVPARRNAFLDDDYRTLYRYLRYWDENPEDERDLYFKKLIREFIYIKANTGLRFGELQKTRWENVKVFYKDTSGYKLAKNRWQVSIDVPAQISKTRRPRKAIGDAGRFVENLKEFGLYQRPKDFVFADFATGDLTPKDTFYKYWNLLMKGSGLDQSDRRYTYYSLRHYYATKRLQEGKIDVYALSKIMGTSVKNIQDHYGQIQIEDMRDYLTRR